MNFNKSKSLAKEPVIRKSTVRVAVAPAVARPQNGAAATKPARAQAPASRFQLTSRPSAKTSAKSSPAPKQPTYADRALASSRKRKSVTPQHSMFSSDEEDDGSSDIVASDSDVSRKRIKSRLNSPETTGPRRKLVDEEAFKEDAAAVQYIHSHQITSGDDKVKYENPWSEAESTTVRLQYPSRGMREKFQVKIAQSAHEYQPLDDVQETIYTICRYYFPPELAEKYDSDILETGFQYRFRRAKSHKDVDEFVDVVKDFNRIVEELVRDGRIQQELASMHTVHIDWMRRILDQIYARTVSPKVDTLKAYENGTDNVYGELLAPFVSKILKQVRLTHDQIFVDLGSGVGNVVLQAALEVGCESWGIEMMPNPCELARLQAQEFRARARLWGLAVGDVHLVQGDFTKYPENEAIVEVLKRADVVLVNNQAFTPSLNDKLRDMFLDLKDGCRVVSLKPFVPEGHKITMRNADSVANLFVQVKDTYFSGSVSWTDQMGHYYIATKDPRPLERFLKHNAPR